MYIYVYINSTFFLSICPISFCPLPLYFTLALILCDVWFRLHFISHSRENRKELFSHCPPVWLTTCIYRLKWCIFNKIMSCSNHPQNPPQKTTMKTFHKKCIAWKIPESAGSLGFPINMLAMTEIFLCSFYPLSALSHICCNSSSL